MIKKFLLFIFALILFGCGEKEEQKIVVSKFAFGTMIDMVVYSSDKNMVEKAIDLAFKELERIDNKFNTRKKGSLTYKINNNPGKFFELDQEGVYLFSNTRKIYDLSNGQYDITIKPLMDLWGFFSEGDERKKLPSKEELNLARSKVDYNNIEMKGSKIRLLDSKNQIDTGSFLKGYAISKAKEILIKNGVKRAFISAISTISTIGEKPSNESWKIGLQNPKDPSKMIHIVGIKDRSIGVSGDYQTYIEIDGKKYHHLIDKKTGYPVKDKKMVIIIGKDSFLTDMYSTAFFTMPIPKILEYVNRVLDLEVMIVKSNMDEEFSTGFKKYIIK